MGNRNSALPQAADKLFSPCRLASPKASSRAASNIRYARDDRASTTIGASEIYRATRRNNHRTKILEAVHRLNDVDLTKVMVFGVLSHLE